jgi:hypothetical protein
MIFCQALDTSKNLDALKPLNTSLTGELFLSTTYHISHVPKHTWYAPHELALISTFRGEDSFLGLTKRARARASEFVKTNARVNYKSISRSFSLLPRVLAWLDTVFLG